MAAIGHDGLVVTQAVLTWLVTFISFLALFGFVFYVARSFSARHWADSTILRAASSLAFVGATAFWVLLIIVD